MGKLKIILNSISRLPLHMGITGEPLVQQERLFLRLEIVKVPKGIRPEIQECCPSAVQILEVKSGEMFKDVAGGGEDLRKEE